MPEPMSIGGFVVAVLVKVAEGGAVELAKSAAKDAYAALKQKVADWAGPKVEVLEAAPDSDKVRREIAAIIDDQNIEEQENAKSLAQAVIDSEANDTGRAVALDFSDLKNVSVSIKEVVAIGNATGARMRGVEGGQINVETAQAGHDSLK